MRASSENSGTDWIEKKITKNQEINQLQYLTHVIYLIRVAERMYSLELVARVLTLTTKGQS